MNGKPNKSPPEKRIENGKESENFNAFSDILLPYDSVIFYFFSSFLHDFFSEILKSAQKSVIILNWSISGLLRLLINCSATSLTFFALVIARPTTRMSAP